MSTVGNALAKTKTADNETRELAIELKREIVKGRGRDSATEREGESGLDLEVRSCSW